METNNEQKNNICDVTEYNFDFSLIANFFKRVNRQGPGSNKETLRALDFVKPFLPTSPMVADIGCGTGQQTAVLAEALPHSHITAVDLLPEMIEGVTMRTTRLGLNGRVTPLLASMEELPFEVGSFDLFWAEGSIYHMGYEKGLRAWHKFMKPGGCLALTECTWLSVARPADASWLTENFTEIDSIPSKLRIMEQAGYRPIACFVLPDSCWSENYYAPMGIALKEFLAEHEGNPTATMFVERMYDEIAHYEALKNFFGYTFFVAQKQD